MSCDTSVTEAVISYGQKGKQITKKNKEKGDMIMKKRILLFAALFLVLIGMAFGPAKIAQAKRVNLNRLNGKYYAMEHNTKIKVSKNRARIKGFLNGYGDQKDAGRVNKSFRLAKNVKYSFGEEVNEMITNERIPKSEFVNLLYEGYSCVNIRFRNGKITEMKIVYD